MTISSNDPARRSLGDGSTRVFDAPAVQKADDLKVYIGGVLKVGGYSVGDVGKAAGSFVTFDVGQAPAMAADVLRLRAPSLTQGAAYSDGDGFPAQAHENALDRRAMIEQFLAWRVERTIRLPDHATSIAPLDLAAYPSSLLGINPAGDAVSLYPIDSGVGLASEQTYNPSWASAVTTSVRDRLMRSPGIRDFAGADDSTRVSNALAAVPVVHVDAGVTHQIDAGAIVLWANGSGIIGQSRRASVIEIHGSGHGIANNAGLNSLILKNLRLRHAGSPSVGSYAIDFRKTLGMSEIDGLVVSGFYNGLGLGPTDNSDLEKVVVTDCLGIGITLMNEGAGGTLQWDLLKVGVQRCADDGFKVIGGHGSGQVTMGDWDQCWTFANSGYGMNFDALATMPIHGVRLHGCFNGENGNSNVRLNTYGRLHSLARCETELAGRVGTGPGQATGASGIGHGVEITANNLQVAISSLMADSNSLNGVDVSGGVVTALDVHATNNGLAVVTGDRNGVRVKGAALLYLLGGHFENEIYALRAAVAANVAWGDVIARNLGTGLWLVDDGGLIQTLAALPATNTLIPKGGVVLGNPSGGAGGDGTLNTQGNVSKNGVAYTNP